MTRLLKYSLSLLALAAVSLGSAYMGLKVGRRFERNVLCCQVPRERNLRLSVGETLGLAVFPSQIGQDKWVTETVFPDLTPGFFLDVGSGDGTVDSNSKVLEQKGWTGICIDPFPTNMHDRTCRMLKEVVFGEAGRKMSFQASGLLGGISDTLGAWKNTAMKAATVEFTTTTLAAILKTEEAPRFIHFISLDIEGAELEALKGFPFAGRGAQLRRAETHPDPGAHEAARIPPGAQLVSGRLLSSGGVNPQRLTLRACSESAASAYQAREHGAHGDHGARRPARG